MHFGYLRQQRHASAVLAVLQADVDEALRLMTMSKISLYDDEGRRKAVEDPISAIYGRLREDILRNEKDTYSWEEVVALCGSYTVSTTGLATQTVPVQSVSFKVTAVLPAYDVQQTLVCS